MGTLISVDFLYNTETVTDKIAILQSQLDLLRKEVDEMQEPILQQPIIKKLDACSSLCSNAFRHLGEEKKGFMDTIKSLQDENQKLKESVQQQGISIHMIYGIPIPLNRAIDIAITYHSSPPPPAPPSL